jgi:ankyrin repeat protein
MSKALKAAIEANDAEATRKAVKTVKDLSRKLPKAEPPLSYACKIGADAVVPVLLEAGALPKDGHESHHPLSIAAESGHPKVIEKLAAKPLPEKVVHHALFSAILNGREEVVGAIVTYCKPKVSQRELETATWWTDGRIFKKLIEDGTDVNVANDGEANYEQLGKTALHGAAGQGYIEPIRLLLDHGANVNATDAHGKTPLMQLAASMPYLDKQLRFRQEQEKRVLNEGQKALQVKIAAQTRRYGDRENADGMAAAKVLLVRGAGAALKDNFGNDALAHYFWESRRDREEPNPEFIQMLERAGAKGLGPTGDLIKAIWADDLGAAKGALAAGTDVNHMLPPPVTSTPLLLCKSPAMIELLLASGADPNKPSLSSLPLISAARGGELEVVKLLIKAGADIHAIEPRPGKSEYIANAYSAADMNRKPEVVDYLKSLGAGQPVLKDWKPLEAGVHMWENFSEVIVKGPVDKAAAAVAQLIGGKMQPGAYGKDFAPGKNSRVVIRPKGMAWCNVVQVTPARRWFDENREPLRELARASGLPVMLIEYSDTAGAAEVERFEPDGTSQKDEGWDRDTLEEVVENLGAEAPLWMKERLAAMNESDEEEKDSSERLADLAKAELFAIAWGGLQAEPGRKVEIAFTNLPAEAFDGVAWVSD